MKSADIAVVIVDMQEFFLKDFSVSDRDRFIKNQLAIIDQCLLRRTPFVLLEYMTNGINRGKTIQKISNKIKGVAKKIIIKENNGGFTDTNLDEVLKDFGVKNILLMGLNANGCIQDTAIGAINRNYKVIIVEGTTASSSRKDLLMSRNNKKWFMGNTQFFESPNDFLSLM